MQTPRKALFDRELLGYKKEQVDSYLKNLSRAYLEALAALQERHKKTAPGPGLQKAVEDFCAEVLGNTR